MSSKLFFKQAKIDFCIAAGACLLMVPVVPAAIHLYSAPPESYLSLQPYLSTVINAASWGAGALAVVSTVLSCFHVTLGISERRYENKVNLSPR